MENLFHNFPQFQKKIVIFDKDGNLFPKKCNDLNFILNDSFSLFQILSTSEIPKISFIFVSTNKEYKLKEDLCSFYTKIDFLLIKQVIFQPDLITNLQRPTYVIGSCKDIHHFLTLNNQLSIFYFIFFELDPKLDEIYNRIFIPDIIKNLKNHPKSYLFYSKSIFNIYMTNFINSIPYEQVSSISGKICSTCFYHVQESLKLSFLISLHDEFKKIIVFNSSNDNFHLLKTIFSYLQRDLYVLSADINETERNEIITNFTQNNNCIFFITDIILPFITINTDFISIYFDIPSDFTTFSKRFEFSTNFKQMNSIISFISEYDYSEYILLKNHLSDLNIDWTLNEPIIHRFTKYQKKIVEFIQSNNNLNSLLEEKKLNNKNVFFPIPKEELAIPRGNFCFSDLINSNYFFIDKSKLIHELLISKNFVSLITRPRRFGKSLNLSMLKFFFEYHPSCPDYFFQFSKLKISNYPEHYFEQGKYPVIFLSFDGFTSINSFIDFLDRFYVIISNEFSRHSYLETFLEGRNLKNYNSFLETLPNLDKDQLACSIQFLSQNLDLFSQSIYKKKPFIFIDEYDNLIHHLKEKSFFPEIVLFLQDFFQLTFKTNVCYKYSVITGIFHISQSKFFSSVNNFISCSILSNYYSKYFGFTEKEVKYCLSTFGLEKFFDQVKVHYNGYLIGDKIIYNPLSLCFFLHEKSIKPFWSQTSIDDELGRIYHKLSIYSKKRFFIIKSWGTILLSLNEAVPISDYKDESKLFWLYLFFGGYLTKVSTYNTNTVIVKNTNVETLQSLITFSTNKYYITDESSPQISEARKILIREDIPDFMDKLKISIANLNSKKLGKFQYHEDVYHIHLQDLLFDFNEFSLKQYYLDSDIESGDGIFDLAFYDVKNNNFGYIFELKSLKRYTDSKMKEELYKSIEQIKRRRYMMSFLQLGLKKIYLIGIVFYKKSLEYQYESFDIKGQKDLHKLLDIGINLNKDLKNKP